MAPGSEPASGSDCAKAVVFSPRRTGKRYFSFCAGLSVNRIGFTSGPNTPGPRGGSATLRATSSQTATIPSRLRPWPPYSVGTSSSHRPRSLALRSRSARTSGRIEGPSIEFISTGMSSRSTKVLTVFLSSFSSSGSSKSMCFFPSCVSSRSASCFIRSLMDQVAGRGVKGMLRSTIKGLVAIGVALAGHSLACAQDTLKVAVGAKGIWDQSISELAQNAGIFKKHGIALDIFYTQGAGETLQAVISGSADLGVGLGTLGVMGAFAKGAPILIIGATMTGANDTYLYVPAASAIKGLQDAAGRTVAFSTTGSSTHMVLLGLEQQSG